jgi:hypothetical protein
MFKIPLVTILRPALQGRRIYCVLLVRMRSFFSSDQRKVALSAGDLNECIVCPKAGRSDKLMERETMSANWRNEFAEFESQNQGGGKLSFRTPLTLTKIKCGCFSKNKF